MTCCVKGRLATKARHASAPNIAQDTSAAVQAAPMHPNKARQWRPAARRQCGGLERDQEKLQTFPVPEPDHLSLLELAFFEASS